ncbi:MAG: hypothetical protein LBG42_02625, partial [Treponema sp.]|nr:hypothetical protein [Treponema sp.]
MKKCRCFFFFPIAVLVFSGCLRTGSPEREAGPGAASGAAASGAVLTDALGRTFAVPPQGAGRIVSLSPGVTEILFAVGAGGRVAGVTEYCDYPPEARNRVRVGGFA